MHLPFLPSSKDKIEMIHHVKYMIYNGLPNFEKSNIFLQDCEDPYYKVAWTMHQLQTLKFY